MADDVINNINDLINNIKNWNDKRIFMFAQTKNDNLFLNHPETIKHEKHVLSTIDNIGESIRDLEKNGKKRINKSNDNIHCSVCDGRYTRKMKYRHDNSLKHRKEEAKIYGKFDFIENKIIDNRPEEQKKKFEEELLNKQNEKINKKIAELEAMKKKLK